MGETWDIMFKVIIIGDTGTGKVYACVRVFKWVCVFVYVCVRESESVSLCLFAIILVGWDCMMCRRVCVLFVCEGGCVGRCVGVGGYDTGTGKVSLW